MLGCICFGGRDHVWIIFHCILLVLSLVDFILGSGEWSDIFGCFEILLNFQIVLFVCKVAVSFGFWAFTVDFFRLSHVVPDGLLSVDVVLNL